MTYIPSYIANYLYKIYVKEEYISEILLCIVVIMLHKLIDRESIKNGIAGFFSEVQFSLN